MKKRNLNCLRYPYIVYVIYSVTTKKSHSFDLFHSWYSFQFTMNESFTFPIDSYQGEKKNCYWEWLLYSQSSSYGIGNWQNSSATVYLNVHFHSFPRLRSPYIFMLRSTFLLTITKIEIQFKWQKEIELQCSPESL